MKGLITTYFQDRKYGCIKDENGDFHFFHSSNYTVREVPKTGTKVTFELTEPSTLGKPMQAVNVTPIAQDAQEASGKAGA